MISSPQRICQQRAAVMSERENTMALAVAKQIATFNGQIFAKLDAKQRATLMTLAHSIIATVERLRKV